MSRGSRKVQALWWWAWGRERETIGFPVPGQREIHVGMYEWGQKSEPSDIITQRVTKARGNSVAKGLALRPTLSWGGLEWSNPAMDLLTSFYRRPNPGWKIRARKLNRPSLGVMLVLPLLQGAFPFLGLKMDLLRGKRGCGANVNSLSFQFHHFLHQSPSRMPFN